MPSQASQVAVTGTSSESTAPAAASAGSQQDLGGEAGGREGPSQVARRGPPDEGPVDRGSCGSAPDELVVVATATARHRSASRRPPAARRGRLRARLRARRAPREPLEGPLDRGRGSRRAARREAGNSPWASPSPSHHRLWSETGVKGREGGDGANTSTPSAIGDQEHPATRTGIRRRGRRDGSGAPPRGRDTVVRASGPSIRLGDEQAPRDGAARRARPDDRQRGLHRALARARRPERLRPSARRPRAVSARRRTRCGSPSALSSRTPRPPVRRGAAAPGRGVTAARGSSPRARAAARPAGWPTGGFPAASGAPSTGCSSRRVSAWTPGRTLARREIEHDRAVGAGRHAGGELGQPSLSEQLARDVERRRGSGRRGS